MAKSAMFVVLLAAAFFGCGEPEETCTCSCTCGSGDESTIEADSEDECGSACSSSCGADSYTANFDCVTEG